MRYLSQKVFIYGCDVVHLVESELVMPVCTYSRCIKQQGLLPSLPFLSHGVVVYVVEKPVKGVDCFFAPLCIVNCHEEEVLGIHKLIVSELVVKFCILGGGE